MIKGFKTVTATSPHGASERFIGEALYIRRGYPGHIEILELSIDQPTGAPLVGVVPDSWALRFELNQ